MRFRGRVFGTLAAARTARDGHFMGGDVWTLFHDEGIRSRDYQNPRPGRAATRMRTLVKTFRAPIILRNAGATQFACPEKNGGTLTGASLITSGFDDGDETT